MTITAETRAADLGDELQRLFDREPEVLADPFPVYERARREAPVLRVGPVVCVTGYADVQAVLGDPATFSSVRAAGTRVSDRMARLDADDQRRLQEFVDHESLWLVQMDEPAHTRVRKLVASAFTPRKVNQMADLIQELVDGLLADADRRGSLDLVRELSFPLPLQVVCRMLGTGIEEAERIRDWSNQIAIAIGTDYSNVREASDAVENFRAMVRGLVAERRAGGADDDDLFGTLIQATEVEDGLTEDELVAMCTLLLFAGHETTTNLISNSVWALQRNRDQWDRLAADPSLTKGAVNEFLRYNTSVQAVHRVALADAEIGGVPVRKGESIRVIIASANRDDSVFEDPDVMDVARENASRHVGMGFGIHSCLGIWLAKLETEIAVRTLVERYPDARITAEPRVKPIWLLYGPEELALDLRP